MVVLKLSLNPNIFPSLLLVGIKRTLSIVNAKLTKKMFTNIKRLLPQARSSVGLLPHHRTWPRDHKVAAPLLHYQRHNYPDQPLSRFPVRGWWKSGRTFRNPRVQTVSLKKKKSTNISLTFQPRSRRWEVWRYLSYCLVHQNWNHIIINTVLQVDVTIIITIS